MANSKHLHLLNCIAVEDAKTRSCPVRSDASNVPCAASRCMAWKWSSTANERRVVGGWEHVETFYGYCGLVTSQDTAG